MTAREALDAAQDEMLSLAKLCRDRQAECDAAGNTTGEAISELQAKTFESCADIIREKRMRITE